MLILETKHTAKELMDPSLQFLKWHSDVVLWLLGITYWPSLILQKAEQTSL